MSTNLETPAEDFLSSVADFGIDSQPEEVSPLPANATEEAGDAVQSEQAKGEEQLEVAATESGQPQEVKAEPVKAEEAKIEEKPAEESQEAKAARPSFWDHFISSQPIGEILDHMQTQSPSRYGEMETEVLGRRLADPAKFALSHYERDPEGYGRQSLAYYEVAKDFYRQQVIKDNPDIQAALTFHEKYKDSVKEEDDFELTSDIEEDIRALHDPAVAERMIKRLKATSEKKPEEPKTETPKSEEVKKPAAQPPDEAIQTEIKATLDAGYNELFFYLGSKADDPKQLGLKVTPEERERAPEVADLKDFKRHVLFDAYGDLPDFERGLFEWAKERDINGVKFIDAFDDWKKFAVAREKPNAIAAAKKMIPFADQYMGERLKNPIFARIDKQIQAAIQAVNPTQKTENFTPGTLKTVSQPASPETAFFDEAANYGL